MYNSGLHIVWEIALYVQQGDENIFQYIFYKSIIGISIYPADQGKMKMEDHVEGLVLG